MPVISNLSDIVSPDEVRAMLGVAAKEFKDQTLQLPIYLRSIKIECDRADARLWGLYKGLPDSGLTDDQQNFSDLFCTFVGWSAAKLIAIALPQFSPQEVGNGQAVMHRNDDAATSVMADIRAQVASVVPLLVTAADVLDPVQPSNVKTAYAMGRFGASGDPVTG
jgi:hypothetical protein